MSEPLITIVIPVHDRASIVGATLDSILSQSYRPLRVILVDNDSSDNTLEVLTQWQEQHRSADFIIDVIQESTHGAAAARNAGLALVESPWTLFFDSDDTMDPGHVQRIAEAIEANSDVDLFGWDVEINLLDGKRVIKSFSDKSPYYSCIMHGNLATQRYLARTDLFRRAGGWEATVMAWNDIEFGVRLLNLMPKIKKIEGAPTVHIHATLVSISGEGMLHNVEHRIYSTDCMLHTIPQAYSDIVRLKRIILAANIYHESHLKNRVCGKSLAAELSRQSFAEIRSRYRRKLIALAYKYTKSGGRGAVTILQYLL